MKSPVDIYRVCTESWILENVLKFAKQFSRPGKSLENRDKVWMFSLFSFSRLQQVLNKWIFSVVKSHSILPIAKTFNHRMRSLIILLCPHCTVVTVSLQCMIMKKSLGSTFTFTVCFLACHKKWNFEFVWPFLRMKELNKYCKSSIKPPLSNKPPFSEEESS